MKTNFIEELKWRGLVHNLIPETEAFLLNTSAKGYIGFDPTSDSLHIGSLVQVIILKHFQKAGHCPIVLIGGATGMIGDPSGKSDERNLLNLEILEKNCKGLKTQFEKFLNFSTNIKNPATIINNYDWMKSFSLIDFSRDIGKHLTVNYMMAKESVKKRLTSESKVGMSFTEFTYQLIQGYDFYHLFKTMDCKLQMGGSDQWGNITTGAELIRRKEGSKAFAITCPLIKKSDGSKFGKTEEGNIWLDETKTSCYKFYQFWLNTSDEDSKNYIKMFTFLSKAEIEKKINEHSKDPHLRILQKTIAKEVTILVHGEEAFGKVVNASKILFGNSTEKNFQNLDSKTFLELFEGVPQVLVEMSLLVDGLSIINALVSQTGFLKSNGEARRALTENAISVNQKKVNIDFTLGVDDLIAEKYILLRKGKKNYFIIKANL